jgi:DNA modification methylase
MKENYYCRTSGRQADWDRTYDELEARHEDDMEELYCGDCLDVLDRIPANSVDLFNPDPPYGLGSMGKRWDVFRQNRRTASQTVDMGSGMRKNTLSENREYQEWVTSWATKVLRVLKPGALAFICMSPRQDLLYRMIVGLEDAGFDVSFSSLYWTYASGYPKGRNLRDGSYAGFQPKPAVEVIVVAMKPLDKKTYKEQAKSNGHGITWMDDCRIPYEDQGDFDACDKKQRSFRGAKTIGTIIEGKTTFLKGPIKVLPPKASLRGRFPANLLVSDDILNNADHNSPAYNFSRYFSLDAWARNLPFLIVPKPSKREKTLGLDGANPHCTVKPIDLMCYLITMGSRPGQTVLDCFGGSFTTGIAARLLGRRFIGVEINPVYFTAGKKRMEAWKKLYDSRAAAEKGFGALVG